MGAAIKMGLETDTLFINLSQLAKAEDLESATVGQDRPVPVHEFVQTAESRHPFMPGAQVKMVGVAENNLGTDLLELLRQHPLDRALGSNRHEGWRFNPASPSVNRSATRLCVMTHCVQLEFKQVRPRLLFILFYFCHIHLHRSAKRESAS